MMRSAEDDSGKPLDEEEAREQRKAEREQLQSTVRSAFFLGMERTLEHDVDLGIRQLSDIALKGLSPGINDPTTAIICIDRLAELLDLALKMAPGTYVIRDDDEQVRVLVDLVGFEVYLGVAFDQVRHYGAGDVTVTLHLLETLEALNRKTNDPVSRRNLKSMAELAVEEALGQSHPKADQARMHAGRLDVGNAGDGVSYTMVAAACLRRRASWV